MGLKQSIVVTSDFTLRLPDGTGTNGSTPGKFVIEYMSRGGATEILTPVRLNEHQDYILNYMLRDAATESAGSVSDMKAEFQDLRKLGGKAFGYGEISLSDEKLNAAADDVQKKFNSGKTILKTIISFEEPYLRETGIIRPDFHLRNAGDYRGNIDQLKLRMAIMNGLKKTSRNYDDLHYIGTIQVDTKHIHCHLVMFDGGVGTIMPDGTQRGKLTDREKSDIRRGIDMFLDEKQSVKMMTSNVQYDKQNTVGYIKRFTHEVMNSRGFAQFMIACLPDDRSMWRAGSNASEMKKPNGIVREYVEQVLAQPDSGYDEAMQEVRKYASYRRSREDLTGEYYRNLIEGKREEIIKDSMNAVYSVLKQIPEEDLDVMTPFMDVMSMPYEEAASGIINGPGSIEEFCFRLRTYKTRLDHHAGEYRKYHGLRKNYEDQMKQDDPAKRPNETSRAVYEFYQVEENYNEMLMEKYRYFLDFIPPESEYMDGFKELSNYGKRIVSLQRMMSDSDMRHMLPDTARQYGNRVYGVNEGNLMVEDPSALKDRLEDMRKQYDDMRDRYETRVAAYGFHLTEDDTLARSHKYPFDTVKALDIHHMAYDFPYDFPIPKSQSEQFMEMADRRAGAFDRAEAYLLSSGQGSYITGFPVLDINLQRRYADRFRVSDAGFGTITETSVEKKHASRTIRLDYEFYTRQEEDIQEDIRTIVKNTVSTLQYE